MSSASAKVILVSSAILVIESNPNEVYATEGAENITSWRGWRAAMMSVGV
ncbi:hypothetical protein [Paenibacillus sp. FSL R10-2734]